MIYISTHKDFNLNNEIIINNKDNFNIIDGSELKNNYSINIINETSKNNILYDKHIFYGDLTRQYYIYRNIQDYNDNIIGFMQYGRFFNNNVLENYKNILNKYQVILPGKHVFGDIDKNIMVNFNRYHYDHHLDKLLDLLYIYRPSYRKYINIFKNINYIIPHNMFIMKLKDFKNYCKFIFTSIELLNLQNIYIYERCFSFLNERLSNLFFLKNFDENKIYYDNTIMI